MGTSDPAQIRAIQAARDYVQAVTRLEEVLEDLAVPAQPEPPSEGTP